MVLIKPIRLLNERTRSGCRQVGSIHSIIELTSFVPIKIQGQGLRLVLVEEALEDISKKTLKVILEAWDAKLCDMEETELHAQVVRLSALRLTYKLGW